MFTADDILQLIASMSLDEMCSLLSGSTPWLTEPIERLDIPAFMMTDGPHGLRKESGTWSSAGMAESDPATCFPTAITLASTWDRELMHEVGVALAQSAYFRLSTRTVDQQPFLDALSAVGEETLREQVLEGGVLPAAAQR